MFEFLRDFALFRTLQPTKFTPAQPAQKVVTQIAQDAFTRFRDILYEGEEKIKCQLR